MFSGEWNDNPSIIFSKLLNSDLKDNIPSEKKSGIYQINSKVCEKIYIGKTKRNLETRVKEHFRNIKNGEIEKIAEAAHVCKEKYAMNHKPVVLIILLGGNQQWRYIMLYFYSNQ